MIEIRWFFIYEVLYIKELDNIDELLKNNSMMPQFLRYLIYLFKKMFCILTIKSNNICVLPYKRINNKLIISIITKIIIKTTKNVVLSNYLNNIQELNKQFNDNGIHIYKGNLLSYYLIYNCIDYISKIRNEDTFLQEVYILVNNLNEITKNTIIYLSKKIKRVNVVTSKINSFSKISDCLEELGIAITVTNNKRKSLSKAKFIINIDFSEEMLNSYNINIKAIIIEINKNISIKSKLFNGINVLDYQMDYESKTNYFYSNEYKKFDKKLLYEQSLDGKSFDNIMKQILEDKAKIVNLIGKNGVINTQEYLKI